MTDRAQLLFVSYCFAPVLTPEAIQNGRTLRALAELCWETTVLTADEATVRGARDARLLDVLPGNLMIVRSRSAELPFTILRGLPIKILMALGLPELQTLWYRSAVRAGRELVRSRRFDAMHSWSSYPVSHLVALALRRETGLPWVLHFSDPWSDSPYFGVSPLRRAVAKKLERAVIGAADAIVFITEETRELVMSKYPKAWREKAHVIAHGYLAEDVIRPRPTAAAGPLVLTHAGSFYLGMREPYTLIAAVARLHRESPLDDRLRLVFVGPTLPRYVKAAADAGLAGIVTWTGPVSWAESQRLVEGSDVLVVIDAQSEGPSVFLPSKLVDYLSARKPILGLTPAVGSTASLLRRLGCPVLDPEDVTGVTRAIDDLVRARRRGTLELPMDYVKVADEYEIRPLTRVLDRILRDAIRRSPSPVGDHA